MTWLLDGNVLAALAIDTHEHHWRAQDWFASVAHFATCAVTQGTLLRIHMLLAEDHSAAAAWRTLSEMESMPQHEFWKEGFSYARVPYRSLQGPKQVTDAWLIALAKKRESKLATLNEALAVLHRETAVLLPL